MKDRERKSEIKWCWLATGLNYNHFGSFANKIFFFILARAFFFNNTFSTYYNLCFSVAVCTNSYQYCANIYNDDRSAVIFPFARCENEKLWFSIYKYVRIVIALFVVIYSQYRSQWIHLCNLSSNNVLIIGSAMWLGVQQVKVPIEGLKCGSPLKCICRLL